MEVRINEPMTKHTSFRAGGAARWFAVPETVEELTYVLGACKKAGAPWYVLGNGSNLLVSDKGFPGVIISMDRFDRLEVNGTEITVGAGVILSRLANTAYKAGLTGLEFAAGIPGTVGGACVMNAGAYGSEMKHILKTVTVLTPEGSVETLPAEELAGTVAVYNPHVQTAESIEDAIEKAYELANEEDVILAFGSLSHLGAIVRCVKKRRA